MKYEVKVTELKAKDDYFCDGCSLLMDIDNMFWNSTTPEEDEIWARVKANHYQINKGMKYLHVNMKEGSYDYFIRILPEIKEICDKYDLNFAEIGEEEEIDEE
jgi:hypothetical protein